ncbi:MAG: hypothetical protein ACTTIV_07655 [Campylobacter sp.]
MNLARFMGEIMRCEVDLRGFIVDFIQSRLQNGRIFRLGNLKFELNFCAVFDFAILNAVFDCRRIF